MPIKDPEKRRLANAERMRRRRAEGDAWIDPEKEAARKRRWYDEGGKEKIVAANRARRQRANEQGVADFAKRIIKAESSPVNGVRASVPGASSVSKGKSASAKGAAAVGKGGVEKSTTRAKGVEPVKERTSRAGKVVDEAVASRAPRRSKAADPLEKGTPRVKNTVSKRS